MNTFPINNGKYEVGPGLADLNESIFIRNEDDSYFKEEKQKIFKQHIIYNHYCTMGLNEITLETVLAFLLTQYQAEGYILDFINPNATPERIFNYFMLNIQEDLCIFQRKEKNNWLALAHVAFPSRWNPSDRIGKNFNTIHDPVPSAENLIKHSDKIVDACINKGPFERWAWGLYPTYELNFHPEENKNIFDEETQNIFFRSERQCIIGFPDINAFMFTIRPFVSNIIDMTAEERQEIGNAVMGMNEEETIYKIGNEETKINIINKLMN